MLIDLKKYFSGEDISQAIDYTVDLSEVEIDGCKPFVTPVQVKGSIRSFASSAELWRCAMRVRCRATGA